MVRQPQNLAEAKEIFVEEKVKLTSSISAIAGSRWLMAILATFALTFGAHLIYAPSRVPPIAGFSVQQTGLPSSVDFGLTGEQIEKAREAAERQGAGSRLQQFLTDNEEHIPLINAAGFGAALLLLLGNIWIMTKRRRVSRG